MLQYSKWLIRLSAIYAVVGGMIGSHMAGSKDYYLTPLHAHILVVGWLTLFAYGVFYRIFPVPKYTGLAKMHVFASIIGATFMPILMLMYTLNRTPLTITAFISSAVILLIGIILFAVLTLIDPKLFVEKNR
jgi:hypothetical protein